MLFTCLNILYKERLVLHFEEVKAELYKGFTCLLRVERKNHEYTDTPRKYKQCVNKSWYLGADRDSKIIYFIQIITITRKKSGFECHHWYMNWLSANVSTIYGRWGRVYR